MIWRDAQADEGPAIVALSREPMPGRIQLIWGLATLAPPAACTCFRVYVLEDEGRIIGTAMTWDWPGGHRYLAGLRFAADLKARPPRALWTEGYRTVLEGCTHAWTSIGADNHRTRRLLLSGRPWLPAYRPCQALRSWYIPLPARNRRPANADQISINDDCIDASQRYVAVAAGRGVFFRAARLAYELGLPGWPRARTRIRIAHVNVFFQHPSDEEVDRIRTIVHSARGIDGLVLTLPAESALAHDWARCAPAYCPTWDSTLFSVTWSPEVPLPELPAWKGAWL